MQQTNTAIMTASPLYNTRQKLERKLYSCYTRLSNHIERMEQFAKFGKGVDSRRLLQYLKNQDNHRQKIFNLILEYRSQAGISNGQPTIESVSFVTRCAFVIRLVSGQRKSRFQFTSANRTNHNNIILLPIQNNYQHA